MDALKVDQVWTQGSPGQTFRIASIKGAMVNLERLHSLAGIRPQGEELSTSIDNFRGGYSVLWHGHQDPTYKKVAESTEEYRKKYAEWINKKKEPSR